MTKRRSTYKRSASKSRKDTEVEDIPEIVTRNTMERSFKVKTKFQLTDTHKSFAELCYSSNTKIAFVDGPAGTAKTYCAAYVALNMLRSHRVDEIVYIRSIIESASKSMGSLPGEVDDKFLPWTLPLQEKLNELIPFQFIFIGIFGLIIDLIKAPGFILGSTLSIFNPVSCISVYPSLLFRYMIQVLLGVDMFQSLCHNCSGEFLVVALTLILSMAIAFN